MTFRNNLNILLIQIREDEMKEHEFRCLVDRAGLPASCVESHDVFTVPLREVSLEGRDLVIVGGSGSYCISKNNLPCQGELLDVIRQVAERRIPLLGLCYGFHAVTEALGGSVIHDEDRQETKTFEVTRTEASDRDPAMSRMPRRFLAQFGHTDHARTLPPGAVNMASTERSEYQAWTIPGRSVYAIQFHAELDEKAVKERLTHYRDKYFKTQADLSAAMADVLPTPEASKFLEYFLAEYIVNKKTYPVDGKGIT